jgi:hypothetical protein
VVSAYSVGAEPQRTWSATFASDSGTALDLAKPVVSGLRKRGHVPIAEYVGPKETNTGLYSFAAPTFAVYVVLGEDAGRPNIVITIRGTADKDAGLPAPGASLSTQPPVPEASPGAPTREATPGAPVPEASPGAPTREASPRASSPTS